MTNEELAKRIKNGEEKWIPTIWEQIEDFIKSQANKRLTAEGKDKEWYYCNMVNQSYFHFLQAIEDYSEENGRFLTYLDYHLKTAFTIVLYGGVTKRAMQDPVNHSISIQTPIGEEDITLKDTIIDEEGEQPYRELQDEDFLWYLHRKLRKVIKSMDAEEKVKWFFLYMLDNGTDYNATRKVIPLLTLLLAVSFPCRALIEK